MNNTYEKSYVEVLEILKHIPIKEYEKIPKEKIEFYKSHCDKNYKYIYGKGEVSKKTYSIIVNLYRNYIATSEEKIQIDNSLRDNLIKSEIIKLENYNPNDIFKNKNIKKQTLEMKIQPQNKSLLCKLIDKIKNFIYNKFAN